MATPNVAIHVLHVLPQDARGDLTLELTGTTKNNAAEALRRRHRSLELDGPDRAYTAEDRLATVFDTACLSGQLLAPAVARKPEGEV